MSSYLIMIIFKKPRYIILRNLFLIAFFLCSCSGGIGKTGHLVEPKSAWKRILERAGIANLRIHDLRSTLGSYQAITGASLQIIGKTFRTLFN